MAYDEASQKGNFTPEGTDKTYKYEVESWVRQGDWPNREHSISEGDLRHVDFMVVKVTSDEEDISFYDTLWGPMDDWHTIEGYLAYDFGEDGSIEVTAA